MCQELTQYLFLGVQGGWEDALSSSMVGGAEVPGSSSGFLKELISNWAPGIQCSDHKVTGLLRVWLTGPGASCVPFSNLYCLYIAPRTPEAGREENLVSGSGAGLSQLRGPFLKRSPAAALRQANMET